MIAFNTLVTQVALHIFKTETGRSELRKIRKGKIKFPLAKGSICWVMFAERARYTFLQA